MGEDSIGERLRAIHFIQACLRLIAFLRVVARHPGAITDLGFDSPDAVVETPELADVNSFVDQVAADDKAPE